MSRLLLLKQLHFEIMKVSESIVNNLLNEVDSLTYRVRVIKQCYKTTSNKRLIERLINENKKIFERIMNINKVSKIIMKRSNEKITLSALLEERSRRSLNEIKTENRLFLL